MKKSHLIWLSAAVVILAGLAIMLWLTLAKPTNIIGICFRDDDDTLRTALEERLKEQGYEVITVSADGDQARQTRLIGELKERNCKALLVEPVMAVPELLTALEESGLPAVLFHRPVEAELLQQYPDIAWVGTDAAQPGFLQGQLLSQLPDGGDLNGDGTISYIVLQGPEDHVDTVLGVQSLEKALEPMVTECLSLGYGELTADSGRKLCKEALAAYGKDIEVIFCGSGTLTQGVLEAIADGGRTVGTDVYLFTAGDGAGCTGTARLDTELLAFTAADTLLAKLQGEPTEQITVVSYEAELAD